MNSIKFLIIEDTYIYKEEKNIFFYVCELILLFENYTLFNNAFTLYMRLHDQAPRMMLLMGIKTNLIIYPMNPITKKPMAHA